MGIRIDFEYQGDKAKPDTEYPGSFVMNADRAGWARIPAIGEAITMHRMFVVRVTWVLWSMFPEDDVVIHVEPQAGYEHGVPTRQGLIDNGWREA